jgi:hypothetical protein
LLWKFAATYQVMEKTFNDRVHIWSESVSFNALAEISKYSAKEKKK